jgi:hypothetical protein
MRDVVHRFDRPVHPQQFIRAQSRMPAAARLKKREPRERNRPKEADTEPEKADAPADPPGTHDEDAVRDEARVREDVCVDNAEEIENEERGIVKKRNVRIEYGNERNLEKGKKCGNNDQVLPDTPPRIKVSEKAARSRRAPRNPMGNRRCRVLGGIKK